MNAHELVIDNFAGGGGASLGISLALGRGPDAAINHDAAAIRMHRANHPATKHFTEDVWKAAPRKVTRGRPVGLLWLSPDCKHFSRAKGSKPVAKNIRSLAWVAVRWAAECPPRVLILENVREFEQWGPIVPRWSCACGWKGTEGQAVLARTRRRCPRCNSPRLKVDYATMVPDPLRSGLTFRRFVGRLKGLGYDVAWRTLDAADYGAPTHRKRLFLVARNDGAPIVWPEPTHGDPKKVNEADLFAVARKPWRTAAECIDWSLPCPSIFDRKRPLAEKTLRRIALGIKRYVLDSPRPFLVDMQRDNRARGTDEPLGTCTTQDNRYNLVVPAVVGVGGRAGQSPATAGDAPLGTVTAKNDRALITPHLVCCNHSGKEFRGQSCDCPLCTLTASRDAHGLVAPVLARLGQTGGNGNYVNDANGPLTTITSKAEHLLLAPSLIQTGYGERDGQAPRVLDLNEPMGTVVAGGSKQALVAAFLSQLAHGGNGTFGDSRSRDLRDPLGTVHAGGGNHAAVAANLVHLNRGDKTSTACDEPLRTITADGNHAFLVYSFLTKYFGRGIGVAVDAPLPTATSKDRFGLVTVTIAGATYVIADVGMRMLTPRELARGQGFPDSYQLTGTNTSQVVKIGNSVCPPVARALVEANYVPIGREAVPA